MNVEMNKVLRSVKVQKIIDTAPSGIIRYGISIMLLVFIIIVLCCLFIHYPKNVKANAVVAEDFTVKIFIPFVYINEITPGSSVSFEFEGYPVNQYGFRRGNIFEINDKVTTIDNKNYVTVSAIIEDRNYKLKANMRGTASILISNKTILNYILSEHILRQQN